MTGNALPLWERVKEYENLDFEDEAVWYGTEPNGGGCYGECTKLNNYDEIPIYWKKPVK